MNNRGQTLGMAVIIAITFFIVGMMSINFIRDEVTTVRAADSYDCANTSISDGAKLTCLTFDLVVPYFILLVLMIAGGVITARFVL